MYVRWNIKPYNQKRKAQIGILALNAQRYKADLDILSAHKDVVIYTLPYNVQVLINALFYRNLPQQLDGLDNTELYKKFSRLANSDERLKLVSYLENFLPLLLKTLNIDALMSCSFFYRADIDWQRACSNAKIPFFALHKENMQDGVIYEQMVKRYSSMEIHFFGQRLFLYNHLVKKVILDSNVCDPDIVKVTGAARMDSLFKKVQNNEIAKPKRQVTLFSSHHCIGLLQVPDAVHYFSPDPDEGFVEYFDLVHGHIIEFANNNPDIEVYIKPKWGGGWIDHIESAGKKMGLDTHQIPNLHITWTKQAQDLIESSSVVIGINSTTLLESLIVGRPVVMPLFAEAAGKYYDRHVYFKDYESDAFNVVRDPAKLGQAITDELDGNVPKRKMPEQMIRDYLGYSDDQSTERLVMQIKDDIERIRG